MPPPLGDLPKCYSKLWKRVYKYNYKGVADLTLSTFSMIILPIASYQEQLTSPRAALSSARNPQCPVSVLLLTLFSAIMAKRDRDLCYYSPLFLLFPPADILYSVFSIISSCRYFVFSLFYNFLLQIFCIQSFL